MQTKVFFKLRDMHLTTHFNIIIEKGSRIFVHYSYNMNVYSEKNDYLYIKERNLAFHSTFTLFFFPIKRNCMACLQKGIDDQLTINHSE